MYAPGEGAFFLFPGREVGELGTLPAPFANRRITGHLRGEQQTETPASDGRSEARLLGSVAWQEHQEARAGAEWRTYDRARELKRFYRVLPKLKAAVTRINARGDSETGRSLHHLMVNVLELETALLRPYKQGGLTFSQQVCFRAIVVEGRTYEALAHEYDYTISVGDLQQHVSRALARLVGIIYDPMGGEECAA